jgi:D-serine deaminase-like pyridoxal phosphate-dependent protein
MTLRDLPTPALLVDLDVFEGNLTKMAAHAAAAGKKLRPHAKAHKCLEAARRQMAAGACGLCVATVAEAEYLAAGGIRGHLLTSPIADPAKARRMAALAAGDPDLAVVVDHPAQADLYRAAAAEAGVRLNVLVDLDLGDHRTGIAPGVAALELARAVSAAPALRFQGFQAYSVRGSHVETLSQRAEFSPRAFAPAVETRARALAEGLEAGILSGGSTGLQAGSYVFMDVAYRRIGGVDFGSALTVLATVVSATHADRVTVDAGFKAFSTDRPFGPEAHDLSGVRYEWAGDEFGIVHLHAPSRPVELGGRIRFVPPHCDPTVNLYDRIHAHRGGRVEEVWPVMGRARL